MVIGLEQQSLRFIDNCNNMWYFDWSSNLYDLLIIVTTRGTMIGATIFTILMEIFVGPGVLLSSIWRIKVITSAIEQGKIVKLELTLCFK